VFDICAGSGTTAIACENAGRRWICIEQDETYALGAIARIREHCAMKAGVGRCVVERT
jgi:DNA modification methylase